MKFRGVPPREAKAEVSFKAGVEGEKAHWAKEIEKQVHDAYKGRIEQVVRWVNNNIVFSNEGTHQEWHAKVKDWGIVENEEIGSPRYPLGF